MRKSIVKSIFEFIRHWILPISISSGIVAYLIYHHTPALYPIGPYVHKMAEILQPMLIFTMLFLQFNKISPHDLKPRRWHVTLLLVQGISFCLLSLWAWHRPDNDTRILIETAMLCMITPTAAAAGVITEKLGGSLKDMTAYLVLSNVLASILLPLILPIVHPGNDGSFISNFLKIVSHVFPMLIMPCVAAWIIRYTSHKLQVFLMRYTGIAFYLWALTLVISMALVTRSIILSGVTLSTGILIGLVVLACCVIQFVIGKVTGSRYGSLERATAGQALGQKNTTFEIWLGYTFLSPIVSLAGGFYAVWQNIINSYELHKFRHLK